MSDDEGDDPVVAEYPVFVSHELAGSLHLFQYPLRRPENPYRYSTRTLSVTDGIATAGTSQQTSERLPAPTSRFAMDMRVDPLGSDSFRPKARGGGGAGGADEDDDVLGGGRGATDDGDADAHMLKYELESAPCKLQSSYAVAVFLKDAVHLTPMSSVQQLTPKISDRSDDQFLSALAHDTDGTSSAMQSHLERQLGRLRSVVLSANAATAKPIDLYESLSPESGTVARRLISSVDQTAAMPGHQRISSSSAFGASPSTAVAPFRALPDPLSHYFPLEQCGARDESFRVTRQTLLRYAHLTHPVNEQVKALLQSANLLTLRLALQIVKPLQTPQLDPSTTSFANFETAVLASLRRYAVLVHGVWIASYDTEFRGSLAFIREHVLHTFAHSTGRITAEAATVAVRGNVFLERGVRAVLKSVAELDPTTREWSLKLSEGGSEAAWIAQRFPEDVENQRLQWARRAADIVSNVQATMTSGRILPNRYLKLPLQAGAGGQATPAAATPATQRHQQLQQQPAAAGDAEAQRQTAVRFMRATLTAKGVVNREQMKEFLRSSVLNPASILHGCPTAVVQKAAQECLTTFTASTWILKMVDPASDAARRALITVMKTKPAFTAKDVTASAEAVLLEQRRQQQPGAELESIPPAVAQEVIKEVAEYRTGERLWHLKSGVTSFEPAPPGTLK